MFQYMSGDLLESDARILVNPVNCVGVMGKGLAKQFKERFPENYRAYREECRAGRLRPGRVFWVKEKGKIIANLPTKDHWRNPSRLQYVEEGLDSLATLIEEQNAESIALPMLGCGNGGLKWPIVHQRIVEILKPAAGCVRIEIYGEAPFSSLE